MGFYNEFNKKEKPVFSGITRGTGGFGFGATAGGPSTTPIAATGGDSTDTPGDGYKYHIFNSSGSFVISGGDGNFDVMLQGGGGAGHGPGAGGGNSPGGAGGGGGATGVWSAPASAGTFPVTVGGAGASSRLTNTDASGYIDAGAGGGSTSSNSTPWSAATIAVNLGGTAGPGGSSGTYNGGPGKPAGGAPQPNSLWWKPYIAPGYGGPGGGHGSNNASPGRPYGSGGGGGSGGFDGGGASPGAPGAPGRVVIRYSV